MWLIKDAVGVVVAVRIFVTNSSCLRNRRVGVDSHAYRHCVLASTATLARYQKYSFVEATDHWDLWLSLLLLGLLLLLLLGLLRRLGGASRTCLLLCWCRGVTGAIVGADGRLSSLGDVLLLSSVGGGWAPLIGGRLYIWSLWLVVLLLLSQLWTLLRVGVGACSLSEEYLLLLVVLVGVHGAWQLLLGTSLSKTLSLLVSLSVYLRWYGVLLLHLGVLGGMNFASLTAQIHLLLLGTSSVSYSHANTGSLSKNGATLGLALILNNCIGCLLVLPRLLNAILLRVILSLLAHVDSLFARTGYLLLSLNVDIRGRGWRLECWWVRPIHNHAGLFGVS